MVVGNMCVYVHKYTEKQTSLFIFEPIFLKLFSWSQTSMHHCINLLDSLEAASLFEQASKRQYQPFSFKIAVIKTTRGMYLCKGRDE